jgi:hypothetical protein
VQLRITQRSLELRPVPFFFILPLIFIFFLQGCASNSVKQDPPAVTISISPAVASVVTTKTQPFTATVTNTTNTAVTWQVNGVAGGDSTHGTISASGLYTAPSAVPNPATVTVSAISQADPTKLASATVTLTASQNPVVISISPTVASVVTTKTQSFTATVTNTTNTAVTWQVNGVTGGDSTHGTISASGLYTAPSAVPNPATVTVSAISQADPTKSASATVAISSAPDTTAPTAPSGLTAVASSATQIGLTWTASTDNVAVVGYRVERCAGASCTSFTQIGTTTTALSFADAGLTASTSYSYRVRAADAAGNLSSYSNTATATTSGTGGSSITVSVSPKRGGLTTSQTLSVTATLTNDTTSAGVSWSSSGGGSFSPATSTSGNSVTFTAPASAGVVTITATSIADNTKTATATVGVTGLAGVTTYLNGNSRQGTNQQEYALTTSGTTAVNSTNFGKLFSCNVDAAIYAQPLWVANLSISSAIHNVVFVATQHDTMYAFDADTNANPCVPLWTASLLDTAHGGSTGETWVSSSDTSCGDLSPDVGIVGTPVIDLTSKTIFVVSKTKNSSTFHQRIHALDIATGNEKFSGPAEISATVPGNGVGSSGGSLPFDALFHNQRPALLLVNSHVIISWASHCDNGPYHGWVMSYSASTLSQEAVLNLSPNGNNAGVWMSGNGPAADSSGNIYLATGNGTFDANTGGPDYGDSIIKLGPPNGGTFPIASYFTPLNQASLESSDGDQGSGGVLLLPTVGTKNYLVQAGKDGNIYVADRTNLGGYSTSANNVVQQVSGQIPGGLWGSPTYWNGNVYFGAAQDPLASSDPLRAFSFDTMTTGLLSTSPTSNTSSTKIFGFPGPTAPVSSNGTSNGIVWALDNAQYCTSQSPGCGPAILHAYDATNLATELWKSTQGSGNTAGNAVKFTVPTVANGKVYVGTRGNNTGGSASSTTIPGELDVYGLLPN